MRITIQGRGSINFDGTILPESAKYLQAAPFLRCLSQPTQEFLFDLRYCWGRTRCADRTTVLAACDEIEDLIYCDLEGLLSELAELFPGTDPRSICSQWLQGIVKARDIAERRPVCSWSIDPLEEEIDYYLTQVLGFIRSMEQQQRVKNPVCTPEFERKAKEAPREEKLRFITDITDSMGNEE